MIPELEKIHQIALLQIEGVGPVLYRKLISHFNSAEKVFKANKYDFIEFGDSGKSLYEDLKSEVPMKKAEKEWNYCLKNSIQIISFDDDRYPKRLKNCVDAPQILYYKGTIELSE